ncbi:hypothetical protein PHG31p195 [Aeromonas phage 31]|uniref:Uncharacterized protein n=4 Tax=Biquartavirus TaxID=1912143 RepID=Q6U9A5_9CAUD|nr:hypothetical protein ST44RRORF197c [Aeromonas phage 44RR2.8t]YP_238924.1 hypothetical protein PHG31p195 [Aeromonas phage 31]APU00669.1 hypothetical protein [Aeromonas phage 44RR2.8t.2]APU01088.1 hypothetical protein [Aeromonas phage 31.2]APU01998.1 hypothetical protein [Aeromonas phage L9-6]APU02250.1 hypothetical protein [Aeromonas phage Riv-10]UYD59750.1 hypothetical protein JNMOADIG_00238 [Aeromonas phage avDM5]UYD60520.1 hypothetical protein NPHMPGLK_00185 [Aeromonas phage avDM2]
MIIPVGEGVIAEEVRYFNVDTHEGCINVGIDPDWLQPENLTGTIEVDKDHVLCEHYNRLIGRVYGHKSFAEGECVRTSSIQAIVHYKGDTYVLTTNSVYKVIAK